MRGEEGCKTSFNFFDKQPLPHRPSLTASPATSRQLKERLKATDLAVIFEKELSQVKVMTPLAKSPLGENEPLTAPCSCETQSDRVRMERGPC